MENTYASSLNTSPETQSNFDQASASDCELVSPHTTNLRSSTFAKTRSSYDATSQKHRRRSVFKEEGFDDLDEATSTPSEPLRPKASVRFRSTVQVLETTEEEQSETDEWHDFEREQLRSQLQATYPTSTMPRLYLLAFIIAIAVPTLNFSPFFKNSPGPIGAEAGPIDPLPVPRTAAIDGKEKRQAASSGYCKRWSQQSALVNGTLYLYGGRTTTDANQVNDTWSM